MTARIFTELMLIFSIFSSSYAHRYFSLKAIAFVKALAALVCVCSPSYVHAHSSRHFSLKAIAIFLALVILVSLCSVSYAHGTGYRHSSLRAIALEFSYSTGEAMSYREARVYSPSDEKFAAQSGRTDEYGRFAFVPNVKGEWRVIVRDEEGHQCEAKINITDEFLSGNQNLTVQADSVNDSGNDSGNEIFIRALLGVSVIFNIALVIRRRHNAHQ